MVFLKTPYGYYELPFSSFLPIIVCNTVSKRYDIYCFLIFMIGIFLSPNTESIYHKQQNKEVFTNAISEDIPLLCLTQLDCGFYLQTDTLPVTKYACYFNTKKEDTFKEFENILIKEDSLYVITDSIHDKEMLMHPEYKLLKEITLEREAVKNYIETYKLYKK